MLEGGKAQFKIPADTSGLRFAVVRSTYHGDMTGSMADACIAELAGAGVPRETIRVYEAPGAWEIPLYVQRALDDGYDGVATFGVIVKGETYHFDMMANEIARALMELSLSYKKPVALEVLAVTDMEHARVRTMGKHNKGPEAAVALLAAVAGLRE